MEIFYLKKDEILNKIDKKSLDAFSDGHSYLSEEKRFEHLLGLFLVKFIIKHIYGFSDVEIIHQHNKPVFKSVKVNFNITHSKNIVLAVFNKAPIGVDLEFMKEGRDFGKIMKRYSVEEEEKLTKESFYRFWTSHEANFKLNTSAKSTFSTIIDNEYMLTCASSDILVTNLKVKELTLGENLVSADLQKEFETPSGIHIRTHSLLGVDKA